MIFVGTANLRKIHFFQEGSPVRRAFLESGPVKTVEDGLKFISLRSLQWTQPCPKIQDSICIIRNVSSCLVASDQRLLTPMQGRSGPIIYPPGQSIRPPETKNKAKDNLHYLWKCHEGRTDYNTIALGKTNSCCT